MTIIDSDHDQTGVAARLAPTVRSTARRILKRMVTKAGIGAFVTRGRTPLDLRGQGVTPLDALYVAGGRPVILDIPVERCRTFRCIAYSLDRETANPFYHTVRAIAGGATDRYETSPLQRFYSAWQPRSAADLMGLPDHPILSDLPPVSVRPWRNQMPEEALASTLKAVARDNAQHGHALSAADGSPAYGPVSQAKGELEFARLTAVTTSISTKGYSRHPGRDGDIGGRLLVRGTDWAVDIQGGQHRAPTLAALGWTHVPIRLDLDLPGGVTRRDDVQAWPLVRQGVFSTNDAITLFNRMIEGRPPPGASALATE